MNNLSWFLYLADVLPSLAESTAVLSSLTTVVAIAGSALWVLASEGEDPNWVKPLKILWLTIPLFALAHLIPSQETIYLIAGSEAGEYVASSEVGQEILQNIRLILDHQLQQLQGNSDG